MPQSTDSRVFDLERLCQLQEVSLTRLAGGQELDRQRISALEKRIEEKDEQDAARAELARSARRFVMTTAVGVFASLISLIALVLSQAH